MEKEKPEGHQGQEPSTVSWKPSSVDYMIFIVAVVITLFMWDKLSSMAQEDLVFGAAFLAYMSVLTNAIIIIKICIADKKARPWIEKLEHVTTEIAWGINAYKKYVEPMIELLKGLNIFVRAYEKVTGKKVDMERYVRQRTGPKPKKRKMKKAKIKVWRREDIILDSRNLARPHEKVR